MEWEDVLVAIRQWAKGSMPVTDLRAILLNYKDSNPDSVDQVVADTLIEFLL